MEIKKLQKNDAPAFQSLIEIFKEVFEHDEEPASTEQLEKLLQKEDFMVFGVFLNGEIIGGLTIYVLHRYYQAKPIAYIYDVGIQPEHQGKGYGKALMAEVCEYCKKNGFEDAYVEAESDDVDAVEFYRKTAFTHELNATHFTYSFQHQEVK